MEEIKIQVQCKFCGKTKNDVRVFRELLNFSKGGICRFHLPESQQFCEHDLWIELDQNFNVRDVSIVDFVIKCHSSTNKEFRKKKDLSKYFKKMKKRRLKI